ncbi:hypothetical protein COU15_00990 [Candidatus Kaiserbacteria bacterium CG10_big_fil_rev_8_21_14_0_10_45_20]|uniref:Uncharacterized protein n=1 Tax=Candidatus Kaiserbacteria bacterium CG10_big_fil_rev_8_21_14_0_10_45_20 TaxID=1974607 RepID=A0A2H0UG61_9BACT|nr:MAG: hypothetical protein COU15_00990 [Candidatus Kaiserbacteria bacterium CG10_big_fil_rev_8_21_14_0_10_45_20]
MKRVLSDIIGVLCIGVGLLLFPLPIPLGAIFIAFGCAVLIFTEKQVRDVVRELREKSKKVDKVTHWAQKHLPKEFSEKLKETEPKGDR